VTTVTLDYFETLQAAFAGSLRQAEAMRLGRQHRHGLTDGDGTSWSLHIEGAGAELAAAKAFDCYWRAVVADPKTLAADVGDRLNVRQTAREAGSLIIHPDDVGLFVLAIGRLPTFRLFGPVDAALCKRPEWWRTDTGRPAYFVPQRALDPQMQLAEEAPA
jgi:hypothetical protein